jgi:deoxyribose-phosphate aldolase
VEREITELTERTHARAARIKIILETCYLSRDEKIRLCEMSGRAGADWVKTSTGFGSYGATPEDVSLLKQHAPEPVQVKASGGIRTLEDVLQYQRLGATRVGTSALQAIHSEARRRFLA